MQPDILDEIEMDQQRLATKREQNRARMPVMAGWMDAAAIFAPRVIYAEENGHTVGKRDI